MEISKKTSLSDICRVSNTNHPVYVSIDIGYAQPAEITIIVDDIVIKHFNNRNGTPEIKIGTNQSLVRKELKVLVTVEDKNNYTDESSVEIVLSGLPTLYSHKLIWLIKPSGSVVFYSINIYFKL